MFCAVILIIVIVVAFVMLLSGQTLKLGINAYADGASSDLHNKFLALGELRGKTKAQIIAGVGNPTEGTVPDWGTASWRDGGLYKGYSVTLSFNDGICEWVVAETLNGQMHIVGKAMGANENQTRTRAR